MTRVEADALAILRPLDTTRKCLDFARTRPATLIHLGPQWHLITNIALDELDEARKIWLRIGRHYRKGKVAEEASLQIMYDRLSLIGDPLMANDRVALAALLHRWAAESLVGSPLELYWTPTPFPLEDDSFAST